MKISRVIFYEERCNRGSLLATCSVVLDECIKLNDIRLYRNKNTGKEYLVLPSKQDIYKRVEEANKGVNIDFPEDHSVSGKKKYDEFFHPVECYMYVELLECIKKGYDYFMKTGKVSYRP